MGKKKWRRVRLTDLASSQVQKRVLAALDQAKGQPEPDFSEKWGSESATTGRTGEDLALTPHQESTT